VIHDQRNRLEPARTAAAVRALSGPRATLYGGEAFAVFREKLASYVMERPQRLAHPYFAAGNP